MKLTKDQYLELHRHFLKGENFDVLKELVRSYERKKNHYKNDRAVVLLRVTSIGRNNGNGNGKHFPVSKKNGFRKKVSQKGYR